MFSTIIRVRHSLFRDRHSLRGAVAILLGLVFAAALRAQTPLPIPDTLSGAVIDLAMQAGTVAFHQGEMVDTYGYNGDLLGPTIILQRGQNVTLNVTNTLPDLTTTHWHGLHVSAANDGGPHSLIYPNTTWSPSFTVLDRASTFWYHPHGHGLTDYQVSMGAAGMIIVRDAQEAAIDLPRTYGVDDIPLILQTKAIVDGQIMLHTGLDSVVLANGVRNAWHELPAQMVRLRCVNGASERTFLLGLGNNEPMYVIGTDGGLLPAPVSVNRLQLMPGERVELLLDLGELEGQTFQLMSYGSELANNIIGAEEVGNGMATLEGYAENALNGGDFALVTFAVGAPTGTGSTVLPNTLVPTDPFLLADVDHTRIFTVEPQSMGPMEMIEGPFEINGALMDMDVINEVVPLGNTEIWEFVNNTQVGHPIHIHDIQFNILDRNGLDPQTWELGWKDVVFVPAMGSARVITRFDDHADPEMPYMYHCHLLMHEDEGMMGQFVVVDPNGIAERTADHQAQVWPNPISANMCTVRWPSARGAARIVLLDGAGRTIQQNTVLNIAQGHALALPSLAPGLYTLQLTDANGRHARTTVTIIH
ncbi:MAG: multicopper oxidase domain-containing protein [Flavobacteriales bacterium]|nr:multicopper oxidase domain-containing protein [Flavobacteriales bacterium]